ncbi:MAG: ThuA domain-containing protein [Bacteroidota bacterium]
MKRIVSFLFILLFVFPVFSQPVKVMLVTGGHAYDTVQFFHLFDALEDVEYEHFEQPFANREIAKDLAEEHDVLVFYDMWNTISDSEIAAYIKMTKLGKPFLFLHHSIASYQEWPEFERIIGGKYFQAGEDVPEELLSSYEHDVWVYSKVETYTPVTAGFRELRFFDEVYDNIRISDDIIPLLRTKHPKSMDYIAWENSYNSSKIVYLQPGHDYRTYESEDYRKLVLQAIKYLAKTN